LDEKPGTPQLTILDNNDTTPGVSSSFLAPTTTNTDTPVPPPVEHAIFHDAPVKDDVFDDASNSETHDNRVNPSTFTVAFSSSTFSSSLASNALIDASRDDVPPSPSRGALQVLQVSTICTPNPVGSAGGESDTNAGVHSEEKGTPTMEIPQGKNWDANDGHTARTSN
jgi:hypothetical protein